MRLAQLEAQYKNLTNKYSESHPDIVRIKREIKLLRASGVGEDEQKIEKETITNPVYRQVKYKIEASENDLSRLATQRKQLQEELQSYEKRVAQTHQVQRGYEDLTRDYSNTLSKYQELRAKQLEAEVSQSMETENKAESFTLIEPPMTPAAPSKPNRPKVIMLGLFLSLGATVGLIMLLEILDPGVRGYREIARITGEEPLALIPILNKADHRMFLKEYKGKIIAGAFGIVALVLVLFHFLVMDLNLFWFKFLNKINML